MKDKVLDVINKLKPFLQSDGGDIELVDVDEKNGIVKVKLKGACSACPMSIVTLKEGVEVKIKQEVPEVKKVVAV